MNRGNQIERSGTVREGNIFLLARYLGKVLFNAGQEVDCSDGFEQEIVRPVVPFDLPPVRRLSVYAGEQNYLGRVFELFDSLASQKAMELGKQSISYHQIGLLICRHF